MRDPWETDEPAKESPAVRPETNVNIGLPASSPSDSLIGLSKLQTKKAKPTRENNRSESSPAAAKPINGPLGLLTFDQDHFQQGIIWAEILGKPLSKRERRGYYPTR